MSGILVATVTHNSSQVLESFLSSLRGASNDVVEVVIVDNDSDDIDVVREIVAGYPEVHLVAQSENRGYGAGINAAAAAGPPSEYILITNPDVQFTTGAIDELVAAATRESEAAAFGPKIVDPDGSVYPSARNLPTIRNGVGHALFSRVWPTNPWTRAYRLHPDALLGSRAAGWLSGACILMRSSVFQALDGFDESYFMYFEDVDLGARIRAAGWMSVYVPDSVVLHTGAHSTTGNSGAMDLAHHASAYTYLSRQYSSAIYSPVRLILRWGLAVRAWWGALRRPRR